MPCGRCLNLNSCVIQRDERPIIINQRGRDVAACPVPGVIVGLGRIRNAQSASSDHVSDLCDRVDMLHDVIINRFNAVRYHSQTHKAFGCCSVIFVWRTRCSSNSIHFRGAGISSNCRIIKRTAVIIAYQASKTLIHTLHSANIKFTGIGEVDFVLDLPKSDDINIACLFDRERLEVVDEYWAGIYCRYRSVRIQIVFFHCPKLN